MNCSNLNDISEIKKSHSSQEEEIRLPLTDIKRHQSPDPKILKKTKLISPGRKSSLFNKTSCSKGYLIVDNRKKESVETILTEQKTNESTSPGRKKSFVSFKTHSHSKTQNSIFDIVNEKNNLFTIIHSKRNEVITDDIVKSSDTLELTDEIGEMFKGQKLLINACGIVKGGLRQKRDGEIVFGFDNGSDNIDYDLSHIKDQSIHMNEFQTNLLFKIKFDPSTCHYYFQPVKSSSNVIFIKIDERIYFNSKKKSIIMDKTLYSFAQDTSSDVLIVKEHNKEKKEEVSHFYQRKELKKGDRKIFFSDISHKWYISFDENKNSWYLDHYYEQNQTINCWKVLSNSKEIKKSLVIKIGKNVFTIVLKQKE